MPHHKPSLKGRLSALESIHPPPISTTEYLARVQSASRYFGDEAGSILARELSDADLARIRADLEQMVFGDDRAAAEAFKREVMDHGDSSA